MSRFFAALGMKAVGVEPAIRPKRGVPHGGTPAAGEADRAPGDEPAREVDPIDTAPARGERPAARRRAPPALDEIIEAQTPQDGTVDTPVRARDIGDRPATPAIPGLAQAAPTGADNGRPAAVQSFNAHAESEELELQTKPGERAPVQPERSAPPAHQIKRVFETPPALPARTDVGQNVISSAAPIALLPRESEARSVPPAAPPQARAPGLPSWPAPRREDADARFDPQAKVCQVAAPAIAGAHAAAQRPASDLTEAPIRPVMQVVARRPDRPEPVAVTQMLGVAAARSPSLPPRRLTTDALIDDPPRVHPAAERPRSAAMFERAEPEVRVSIGRIDIREQRPAQAPRPARAQPAPRLGLSEYLDRRFGRGRDE